ncbi:MAG: AMP-binding protein, partial [Actinomycetota bacterium]|nr:AMP-binding protein [Actinomycetota bacterium]
MSFEDLQIAAQRLTAAATDHGLTAGGRIAIATKDSYEAAELFVSAIHAGLPVVPLNVEAGASHLRQVIERGRIDVVVAAGDIVDQATTWCRDTDDPPSIIEPAEVWSTEPAPLLDIDPDAEAFIMYTSGSTGVPKGVVLSHRNALAAGENNRSGYEWSSTDRVLCPLPFWHMNACDKSLGAMASGATMIVPPRFLVGEFWNWTVEQGPTLMIIVPTIAGELLQHPTPTEPDFEQAVAAVRYAGSSSAPLNAAVHDDFVERYGIPMIEAFGMSETGSIFVTTPPPNVGSPGSVGRPAGWEVRIVDPDGQQLPVGEVGSLELRGPALTVGYDDTDVFADAVTPDGWFRTGDIGRFNENREFFVVGRAKEIVIKGGVNIAPREIDEVVMAHSQVVEAATVGVPDKLFGQDIETFAVLSAGAEESEVLEQLSAMCQEELGLLKTPRRFTAIGALPKGPGGKVQPLKLLDLVEHVASGGQRASGSAGDPTAPTTAVEVLVHDTWSRLLGAADLGCHENFFDRGGYSLLALECCVGLRTELRLQIPLALIFENPTVASFSEVLVALGWLRTDAALLPFPAPPGELLQVADAVAELPEGQRTELERAVLDAKRSDETAEPEASAILLSEASTEATATTLPLFCAYGPYQYTSIARQLGADTPVYGLYIADEVEGTDRLSVVELAEQYIGAMRMVQPEGPYHLAGFSFGGRVALEMASQLRAAGHEVALLMPIDTYLGPLLPTWHPRFLRRTVAANIRRYLESRKSKA